MAEEQNPLQIQPQVIPSTNMATSREIINQHMANEDNHVTQLFQLLTLMEV